MSEFYTPVLNHDGDCYNLPEIIYTSCVKRDFNFLFREVLVTDPASIAVDPTDADTGCSKVHIVKSYPSDKDAINDDDSRRVQDCAHLVGTDIVKRLLISLTYGADVTSPKLSTLFHFCGYENGIRDQVSNNTGDVTTSTLSFFEFVQAAIAATYNFTGDPTTTANAGLIDKDIINEAALLSDLRLMEHSEILSPLFESASNFETYSSELEISPQSEINWVKQLVYSIVVSSSTSEQVRFRPIKRILGPDEKFLQLHLLEGDSIVFVFNFQTDENPDRSITIGFKVGHTGGPATAPIGWEKAW